MGHITHHGEFGEKNHDQCSEIQGEQSIVVLCIMRRDQKATEMVSLVEKLDLRVHIQANGYTCEPLLGRCVLRPRINLLPECQFVIRSSSCHPTRSLQLTAGTIPGDD